MTSDDDRIRYLAGDDDVALEPAERDELDELRALLGDPSIWVEPGPGIEDAVVAAISAEAGTVGAGRSIGDGDRNRSLKRRFLVAAGAAAAAAVVVVAVLLATIDRGPSAPRYQAALGSGADVGAERTDSGWRIRLDAPGLPRLDDGRYYQGWLRREDGLLVAIGSFNEGDDVVLWAGVSPEDFPTFTVTEEDADGDQSSSGQVVLRGELRLVD